MSRVLPYSKVLSESSYRVKLKFLVTGQMLPLLAPWSFPSTLPKENPFQENNYLLRRLGSEMAPWPCVFCSLLLGALLPLASLPHLITHSRNCQAQSESFLLPLLPQPHGGHFPSSRLLLIIFATLYWIIYSKLHDTVCSLQERHLS